MHVSGKMNGKNLAKLHLDVVRGQAGNKILFQPRIACWYDDKVFAGESLPGKFKNMTLPQVYQELGCSNRIYQYNSCFKIVEDSSIQRMEQVVSPLEKEYVIRTPIGNLSCIMLGNTSNQGLYPKKWWLETEADFEIMCYVLEHQDYEWEQAAYDEVYEEWGDVGAPTMYMPRTSIQNLYIDLMGVENTVYALMDYPEVVEHFFDVLEKNHEKLIRIINACPIEIINFGDNLHCGTLSPPLFEKYVLPVYQRRCKLLHEGGKFVHSHWDGNTKTLLKYAKDTGLDGIEAITPLPQGDVTLREVKAAFGEDVWLIDGLAAILFDKEFTEEELRKQVAECISLFAPKLILGISDELSSTGDIERVRMVKEMVDEYNALR